jgi:hypothetical protein
VPRKFSAYIMAYYWGNPRWRCKSLYKLYLLFSSF